MPGNLRERASGGDQQLLRGLLALAPGLGHHAAETTVGTGDLEDALAFREALVNVVDLIGEEVGLIDSGVGRGLNDAEHHALILRRREFALREHVERNHQRCHDRPQGQDDGAIAQRARREFANKAGAPSQSGG